MRRTVEWVVSTLAALIGVLGAIKIWQSHDISQNGSIWPVPGLILVQVIFLALLGFLGTVMDGNGASRGWGLLPWIASGGLLALGGVGSNTRSFQLLLLVLPSLGFFIVSLLADQRRNRRVLNNLSILAFSVIINFGLLVFFITLQP